MTERVEVATETDFESTDRQIVEVNGVEIGIFRIDGEYHAILNTCPHQNGPVAEGALTREVVADVPDIGERIEEQYDTESCVIRCPWHAWGFDVRSGENVADSENVPGVPTYDVSVDDGRIYLEL